MSIPNSESNRKRVESLPVSPYIKKWLIHIKGYEEQLEVNKYLTAFEEISKVNVFTHFEMKPGLPHIQVCMYSPSREKLYYLQHVLEWLFHYELMQYVKAHFHYLKVPARVAVKDFLKKCKISEDELAIGTAYKRWQRNEENRLPGMICL